MKFYLLDNWSILGYFIEILISNVVDKDKLLSITEKVQNIIKFLDDWCKNENKNSIKETVLDQLDKINDLYNEKVKHSENNQLSIVMAYTIELIDHISSLF